MHKETISFLPKLHFKSGSSRKDFKTYIHLAPIEHKLLTFYSRLVTWCTISLTFNNCTLCPHCIYVVLYLSENKQRFVPLTA